MIIAIPVFKSRVSPRFDCAQAFLLVTTKPGSGLERKQLVATDWAPHDRINRLVELGVEAVICGGIDWWSAESLRSAGMVVYNSITGDVDEVLTALLQGDLVSPKGSAACTASDQSTGGKTDRASGDPPDGAGPPRPGPGTRRRQRRRGGSGSRGA